MEIPLDPEIERVVLEKVARGEYPSAVALVEEALYLLMQRDWAEHHAQVQERMPWIDQAMNELRPGDDPP